MRKTSIAITLGLAMLFFDQLCWLLNGDRRAFTTTAGVDLAEVFDHADLYRNDFLDGFFADGVLAAAASTNQLLLGQFRG